MYGRHKNNRRPSSRLFLDQAAKRRDMFGGWMAFSHETGEYVGGVSQHHVSVIASRNNKRHNNRPGCTYGTAWHPVYYEYGKCWVMLDFISKAERGIT
jgi:hypothetical protein